MVAKGNCYATLDAQRLSQGIMTLQDHGQVSYYGYTSIWVY